MRKIKINEWDSKDKEGNECNDNILFAFNVLLGSKKPEELPRGLEYFRTFNKISEAFYRADETKLLILEEAEYSFLKNTIEKDIPSIWGMQKELFQAVDEFLTAEEVKNE